MKKRGWYIALYYVAAALFALAAVFFFRRGDTLMGTISSVLGVSMIGMGTVWAVTRPRSDTPEKTEQRTEASE